MLTIHNMETHPLPIYKSQFCKKNQFDYYLTMLTAGQVTTTIGYLICLNNASLDGKSPANELVKLGVVYEYGSFIRNDL